MDTCGLETKLVCGGSGVKLSVVDCTVVAGVDN